LAPNAPSTPNDPSDPNIPSAPSVFSSTTLLALYNKISFFLKSLKRFQFQMFFESGWC